MLSPQKFIRKNGSTTALLYFHLLSLFLCLTTIRALSSLFPLSFLLFAFYGRILERRFSHSFALILYYYFHRFLYFLQIVFTKVEDDLLLLHIKWEVGEFLKTSGGHENFFILKNPKFEKKITRKQSFWEGQINMHLCIRNPPLYRFWRQKFIILYVFLLWKQEDKPFYFWRFFCFVIRFYYKKLIWFWCSFDSAQKWFRIAGQLEIAGFWH